MSVVQEGEAEHTGEKTASHGKAEPPNQPKMQPQVQLTKQIRDIISQLKRQPYEGTKTNFNDQTSSLETGTPYRSLTSLRIKAKPCEVRGSSSSPLGQHIGSG